MEEYLNNVSGEEMSNDSVDYISAINEIKANSVSKEAYEKLKADNKKLLDSLVSGKELDIEAAKPVDVDELRAKLFGDNELTNLEYIDTALKLRAAVMERGELDPFLPVGAKVAITDADIETAERIAQELQDMVDIADGNNVIFNQEYQRRVSDSIATTASRKRR